MKRAILITLFLHLLLLIFLISQGVLEMELFSLPPSTQAINVNIQSSGSLSPQNEVWQQVNHFAKLSPAERLAELDRLMKEAATIPQKSLDEIGEHLGLDADSHLPKITDKPFDHSTATIHSLHKKPYPQGKVGYVMTLVDAAGTTIEVHYTPAEVTPELISAYRAMALLELSPGLKQIAIRFLSKMAQPRKNDEPPKKPSLPSK